MSEDIVGVELLPCPFCGGKAELSTYQTESLWSHDQVTYTQVGCGECDYSLSSEPGFEVEAPERWNTRTLTPEPSAAVDLEGVAEPKLVAVLNEALIKQENDRTLWSPEWQIWAAEARAAIAAHTNRGEVERLREALDDPCPDGGHCCCCAPGRACCDCGTIIPFPSEIDALRRALTNLTRACELADAREDLSLEIDGSMIDDANEALELHYPVIWTDEDVAKLRAHQDDATMHPYTCGRDRTDAAHRAVAEEECEEAGALFPTVRGWKCPACDYRQFWAHGVVNLPTLAARAALSSPDTVKDVSDA